MSKNCSTIEGVDLSKNMLAEARKKTVYDKLHCSDILEYLEENPLDFDLFIATDVFIYVGSLSEIFRLIKRRNKRPGVLAFSTEHIENGEFFLEDTGRYSHSKQYIKNLCKEFNYKFAHFEIVNLRKEKGQFLHGGLYLLDF